MGPFVIGEAVTPDGWMFFIVCGAIVVGLVWRAIRHRLQRRAAAHAPEEQHYIWRREFMNALIDLVGHDPARSRTVTTIRRHLKWNESQALLVVDYLKGKELIRVRTDWTRESRVNLTGAGLDEAIRAKRGPTEHLPTIVADHSIVTVNSPYSAIHSPASSLRSRGSVIQSPGSTTQTLVQNGMDPADLVSWIEMYRDALDRPTGLSESGVRDARKLLDELDDAVSSDDSSSADRIGRTLRAIAEGVAGNAAFAAVLEAARAFPFGL